MSSLKEFLPKKDNKQLMQAFIEKDLIEKVNKYRKANKLSYSNLIKALLTRLVIEENL